MDCVQWSLLFSLLLFIPHREAQLQNLPAQLLLGSIHDCKAKIIWQMLCLLRPLPSFQRLMVVALVASGRQVVRDLTS